MNHGSWAGHGIAKRFLLSNLGLVACLMTLGSSQGVAGFSLGNGGIISVNPGAGYVVRPFGGVELDVRSGGKPTLLVAPKSDGVFPRTKLTVSVSSVSSSEDAVQALMAVGAGWVTFLSKELSIGYREVEGDRSLGTTRLEILFIHGSERLTMVLEGNKDKSKAYSVAAEQLMEEFN